MVKVAIIGAGAISAPKRFVSDLLSYPEMDGVEIALMDIDPARLETITEIAEILAADASIDADITPTGDREAALTGADYVINVIHVGGREPFENEIRIPESYGVTQAIGDTLGPGGVFRGLRTIPTLIDIATDMERLCPEAPFLNYTNPMAINCWAVDAATDIDVYGLCHSVQGTVSRIAQYLDITDDRLEAIDRIEYWVAGINHLAWVLDCRLDGRDLLPELAEAMTDPEIYEQDTVRFELMKHFGAFPTESSHHASEYLPYFRTDEATIEEMSGTGMAGRMPTATYLEGWLDSTDKGEQDLEELYDPEQLGVSRSPEYPGQIVHSMETDTVRRMNINVRNTNEAIANLPATACVEVPCLVDGTGIHPCTVGELPSQLAALNRSNIHVQEHAVKAAIEGDREAVYHALQLDPLTSAVLTLPEIREMTDELLAANAAYLPTFD